MLFLVQVYYTHPGFRTSIFGKNRAYCIRDFTVLIYLLIHIVQLLFYWQLQLNVLLLHYSHISKFHIKFENSA